MRESGAKSWRRIIGGALSYFGLVFGTGFLLGPLRIILIAPRIGQRAAELIEAPLMLVVIVLSARWIVRRFRLSSKVERLLAGLLAIVPGLGFEFFLVLKLRGLTLPEYFRNRDPVSGTVYYLTLALFALMPLLINRKQKTH